MILQFQRKKEIKMFCDTAGRYVHLEDVAWSDLGLRERLPGELVHLRDEQGERCRACGVRDGVWITADSSHATHRDKCR